MLKREGPNVPPPSMGPNGQPQEVSAKSKSESRGPLFPLWECSTATMLSIASSVNGHPFDRNHKYEGVKEGGTKHPSSPLTGPNGQPWEATANMRVLKREGPNIPSLH